MVTDYQLPITTSSERLLWAVEAKDAKAMAVAVEKCLKNDPTVKRRRSTASNLGDRRGRGGQGAHSISWWMCPVAAHPKKEQRQNTDETTTRKANGGGHLLPHGAITVAHGHLLVASHLEFLLKVLKPIPKANNTGGEWGFYAWGGGPQLSSVAQAPPVGSRGPRGSFPPLRADPAGEDARERNDPGPDAEHAFRGGQEGRARRSGSRQEPARLQGCCADAGPRRLGAVSEPDGWFIKGFLLPKPAAEKAKKYQHPP